MMRKLSYIAVLALLTTGCTGAKNESDLPLAGTSDVVGIELYVGEPEREHTDVSSVFGNSCRISAGVMVIDASEQEARRILLNKAMRLGADVVTGYRCSRHANGGSTDNCQNEIRCRGTAAKWDN